MKNIALISFVIILAGVGCSPSSTPGSSTQTGEWDGVWVMVEERSDTTAGQVVNPATNKKLRISGGQLIEDYSELQGLGDCTSEGEIVTEFQVISEFSAEVDGRVVNVDPYIDCRGVAGTNAVPRSFTEATWFIDRSGDVLSAYAQYGPTLVTQEYERE